MQVFATFQLANPERVKEGITRYYADNYYDAGGNVFFVAAKGETTRQVATKIGLGDEIGDGTTSGIIVAVTSYWGRHNSELWEWIGIKQSSND